MMYECELCGAWLDPGEQCDCAAPKQNEPGGLALRCLQAPVISEDLDNVRRGIDLALAEVAQLPQNDESLKRVRALRAELNKQLETMESQRKEVKRQVMQPYLQAEEKYKACIAEPYRAADQQLKDWVDSYQNGLKAAKETELREYFDELCQSQGVDFLRFSDCGVTVDMAMARQKESRKAMEKIFQFVTGVRQDLDTIPSLEDAPEVLAEYRKSLSLLDAILQVKERKAEAAKAADVIAQQKEAQAQEEQRQAAMLSAMPELCSQLPQEDLYTMTFTVTGTLSELKALKAYILSRNLIIEEDNE